VRVCVLAAGLREIRDRQKRRMAVAELEDQESRVFAYIFSKAYTPPVRDLLHEAVRSAVPLYVEGRTEEREEEDDAEERLEAMIIAERVLPFEEAAGQSRRPAVIRIPLSLVTAENLAAFRDILGKYPGNTAVCASVSSDGTSALLRLRNARVRPCRAFYDAVSAWREAAPEDVSVRKELSVPDLADAFAAAGLPTDAAEPRKS
jgi:DNA polymerase III alpha subunit